jgi:hypothetical protein
MNLYPARRHALPWILAFAVLIVSRPDDAGGCGGWYGPPVYLEKGGRLSQATPEFYFELEMKRLAHEFQPREKRVRPPELYADSATEDLQEWYEKWTAAQDVQDFAAGVQAGQVRTADPAAATQQHAAARAAIDSGAPLGPEVASEFADYHRGASAIRHKDLRAARAAWEALLARPKDERPHRTVWAAFMLGKLSRMELNDDAEVGWYQKTRQLAAAGFADSLGLAADSYRCEAQIELWRPNRRRAAELFLTQLAVGDEQAIESLRNLSYCRKDEEWAAAAADPLLRKLTTIHLLALGKLNEKPEDAAAYNRRWITEMQKLELTEADGAEYLGWLAYDSGEYALAESWLRLAKPTPAALWLRARLLRRAGRLTEAARTMMQVWQAVHDLPAYTQWRHPRELPENDHIPGGDTMYSSAAYSGAPLVTFVQSAAGDFGSLHLARGDFVAALDAFYKGSLWLDAAYVAENVLTVDELKRYVDRQPPEPPPPAPVLYDGHAVVLSLQRSLRYLLGRRLMRDQRYAEALPYLPAPYDKVAREFVSALRAGENRKLPKATRARAWFHAGWIARYAGMELMGTDGAPDGYASRGQSAPETVREERMTGIYQQITYDDDIVKTPSPIIDRPTAAELARLRRTETQPNLRFHYRIVGARLMMKAAALLPDNTPELANVIDRAGLIVDDRDEKLADRWYQQLERRCEKTEVGKKAVVHRWFVEDTGAWSNEERAALAKMLEATRPRP